VGEFRCAAPDAARAARSRRRRGGAERLTHDLPRAVARGETLPVSFVVGCHPDRSHRRDAQGSGRRARPDLFVARGAAGGREMRHQRSAGAGGCRVSFSKATSTARGHAEGEGRTANFSVTYGGVKQNRSSISPRSRAGRTAVPNRVDRGYAMSRTDNRADFRRCERSRWCGAPSETRCASRSRCTQPRRAAQLNVRVALRQRAPGEARNAIQPSWVRSPT